jgi:hypothetical protein
LLKNLSTTLGQVDEIAKRYHSLGSDQKKTWDRVKFATNDLADLRSKIQIHVTSINLFVSSLSAGSLGRIESLLDDLVRNIKAGRKEPTILSTHEDTDELAWDELERELVGDGITRKDVEYYKVEIREYLKMLVDDNDDDDIRPDDSISMINGPDTDIFSSSESISLVDDPDADGIRPLEPVSLVNYPGENHISVNSQERVLPERIVGNLYRDIHPIDPVTYNAIMSKLMTARKGNLSKFTLYERQVVVFTAMATKIDLDIFRIHPPSSAVGARARALASAIAFGSKTFDYQAFPKLGSATSEIRVISGKSLFKYAFRRKVAFVILHGVLYSEWWHVPSRLSFLARHEKVAEES